MAKPAPRTPRTRPEATLSGPLVPAPDNGVPFGAAATKTAPARAGRQLGHRIPEDLYQRLVHVSETTDIPIGRLITRAIEHEVQRHEG